MMDFRLGDRVEVFNVYASAFGLQTWVPGVVVGYEETLYAGRVIAVQVDRVFILKVIPETLEVVEATPVVRFATGEYLCNFVRPLTS
jgi:hypothetical protein